MQTVYAILSCGAGVLLGLVMTGTAQGQTRRPGVHRMEINNGGSQTVRYFGQGISPGETAALRDLERSENELAYVRNLQDLKRQLVYDESQIEAARSLAKQELYNRYMAAGGYGAFGTFPGLDSGLLAAYNLGGNFGLGSYYGLGGYYGLAGGYAPGLGVGGAYAGLLGTEVLDTAIASGFGNNDSIRQSIASVIGQQATPQYAAQIERNVDRAMAQAGSSRAIRVALHMPDASREASSYGRPVAAEVEPTDPVVVTLKDGTILRGRKLDETSKDWVTIITSKGRKTRIRPSEVIRIDEGKSSAIAPAVGD